MGGDDQDARLGAISASVGVATSSGASLDADELTRMAHDALYRAKRRGRNRIEMAVDSDIGTLPRSDGRAVPSPPGNSQSL